MPCYKDEIGAAFRYHNTSIFFTTFTKMKVEMLKRVAVKIGFNTAVKSGHINTNKIFITGRFLTQS